MPFSLFAVGFTVMPCSVTGIILGGLLTSRLAGRQRGYATMTLVVHSICCLAYAAMMSVGCSNTHIAGLTTQYGTDGLASGTQK